MSVGLSDLVAPLRVCISISAVVCAATFWSKLEGGSRFRRVLLGWMTLMGGVALLFSHTNLFGNGALYLPLGVVPGFTFAVASLFWQPAREAFLRLSDKDVRLLMSFRTVFGAFLFAGAASALFPPVFALTAGVGDLLAGWLALAAPTELDRGGAPAWRWVVHGWGAVDLVDVAALGTFVVQPWIAETGSPGPSLLLPWLCVPLLFALNLHGIRSLVVSKRRTS